MHVVADEHLGMPQGSAEAFALLQRAGKIDAETTRRLAGMTYVARVYDRSTGWIGNLPAGIVTGRTLVAGDTIYEFTIRNADVDLLFNDAIGIFHRRPGDRAAIVNFGASPPYSPHGYS